MSSLHVGSRLKVTGVMDRAETRPRGFARLPPLFSVISHSTVCNCWGPCLYIRFAVSRSLGCTAWRKCGDRENWVGLKAGGEAEWNARGKEGY